MDEEGACRSPLQKKKRDVPASSAHSHTQRHEGRDTRWPTLGVVWPSAPFSAQPWPYRKWTCPNAGNNRRSVQYATVTHHTNTRACVVSGCHVGQDGGLLRCPGPQTPPRTENLHRHAVAVVCQHGTTEVGEGRVITHLDGWPRFVGRGIIQLGGQFWQCWGMQSSRLGHHRAHGLVVGVQVLEHVAHLVLGWHGVCPVKGTWESHPPFSFLRLLCMCMHKRNKKHAKRGTIMEMVLVVVFTAPCVCPVPGRNEAVTNGCCLRPEKNVPP